MNICIYEDGSALNFEPLAYSRAVFDLVCGCSTLKDKIIKAFPSADYSLFCRDYLSEITALNNQGIKVNSIYSDDVLFINGRVIADNKFLAVDFSSSEEKLFTCGNFTAAVHLKGSKIKQFVDSGFRAETLKVKDVQEISINYADYIWDLIYANKEEMIREINALLNSNRINLRDENFYGVWMTAKEKIFISEGVTIKAGVVIDASEGPVYIGRNTIIHPNAVIEGPVYIGDNCIIKSGAKIYEAVSIGNVCKMGGEVEDSIIMSYSNKQHEGFIGHAYLGSWVNLGADTNCSDLRNNYGFIKAYVNGEEVNTGRQFLGLIIGDHSKTGINTMFNTGTVAGISCNIYGAGFPDKYIPSFSWGEKDAFVTYDLNKAKDTAKKVMSRRKKEFTAADEKLFECIHSMTAEQRLKKGVAG